MKVKLYECPRKLCRYRWLPRVNTPKECPNCKHRFTAAWGLKPKLRTVTVKSKDELLALKEQTKRWNDEDRWKSD